MVMTMTAQEFNFRSFHDDKTGQQDYGQGVARLNTNVAEIKSAGIRRNVLVKILNTLTKKSIYAVCRSNQNYSSSQIGIERDLRLQLIPEEDALPASMNLEIRRASVWGWWSYLYFHPNISVRVNFKIGIAISFALMLMGGFLGVILSRNI